MKPLCLLDVDGVINLLGAGVDEPCFAIGAYGYVVRATVAIDARLARLHDTCEIVWFTAWAGGASVGLAEHVGLPFVEFLDYPQTAPGESWKINGLMAIAGDRALVLIDDEVGNDMREWAASRAHPTLLLQTDPARGLRDHEVDSALAFAAVNSEGGDAERPTAETCRAPGPHGA